MRIYTCEACQGLGRVCEVSMERDGPAPDCCPFKKGCAPSFWMLVYPKEAQE